MEQILNQFSTNRELFLAIFTVIFAVAYSWAASYFLMVVRKRRNARRKENRQRFHDVLLNGLRTNTVSTIDDVVNIYKGIFELSSEDLGYRYGLSSQLREVWVTLLSRGDKADDSQNYLVDCKEKISEFIRRNEELSPYADLPAAERNILSDISSYSDKNDMDSIKRKLLELGAVIMARSDDLNKIRNINKWSVPLSVVGLVLTILFGLIAVFK